MGPRHSNSRAGPAPRSPDARSVTLTRSRCTHPRHPPQFTGAARRRIGRHKVQATTPTRPHRLPYSPAHPRVRTGHAPPGASRGRRGHRFRYCPGPTPRSRPSHKERRRPHPRRPGTQFSAANCVLPPRRGRLVATTASLTSAPGPTRLTALCRRAPQPEPSSRVGAPPGVALTMRRRRRLLVL